MTVLYILLALVVLLVMITVHEFGHYCAGKILGFKINEFAIGFGPAIYKRKNKKTDEQFSIRVLPLGGFCAFEGEDEEGIDKPGAFNKMPAWKRLIVLLAGVSFNFLFGVLTAAIYLLVSGFTTPKVSANLEKSNFQTNDIIVAVDGKSLEAYRNFSELVSKFKQDEQFTVTVNRDGKIMDIVTSKQKYPAFYFISNQSVFQGKIYRDNGSGVRELINIETFMNEVMRFGAASETAGEGGNAGTGAALKDYFSNITKDAAGNEPYSDEEIEKFITDGNIVYVKEGVSMGIVFTNVGQKYGFFEALVKAWPFCFYLCGLIISSFAGLFTGAVALKDAGGTVTAIAQIAEISQQGIVYFLLLLPLLAMNLAVFNILPIPALDGARCVFVLIELIFRKPVPRKIEGYIHTIGLFLLLGLIVILDLNHFFFASTFLLL